MVIGIKYAFPWGHDCQSTLLPKWSWFVVKYSKMRTFAIPQSSWHKMLQCYCDVFMSVSLWYLHLFTVILTSFDCDIYLTMMGKCLFVLLLLFFSLFLLHDFVHYCIFFFLFIYFFFFNYVRTFAIPQSSWQNSASVISFYCDIFSYFSMYSAF